MKPLHSLSITACSVAVLSLAWIGGAAAFGPVTLPDSTVAETWALPNGLRVTTRHVPKAAGVSITICYEVGAEHDPIGHEGLAALVAEVLFTAPAGGQPERTRAEMASVRPLGWNIKIAPRYTELSEVAAPDQFPGVLSQMAERMRGVTVNDHMVRAASATVKGDLADAYSAKRGLALYHEARHLATGVFLPVTLRYAGGQGLAGLGVKDIQQRLRTHYVPANAVLSIAGNLAAVDAHRLIGNLFDSIPAGERPPSVPEPTLHAAARTRPQSGVVKPIGVAAVIAPALSDSMYPVFYLQSLIIGSTAKIKWGAPPYPVESRFDYSLLEDPNLVVFYPPVPTDPHSPLPAGDALRELMEDTPKHMLSPDIFQGLRAGIEWIFGGPLPDDLVKDMSEQPGALYTLSTGMAVRELWGGETFWENFRRRFRAAATSDPEPWRDYYSSGNHTVELKLIPPK